MPLDCHFCTDHPPASTHDACIVYYEQDYSTKRPLVPCDIPDGVWFKIVCKDERVIYKQSCDPASQEPR